ncbi:MAG: nucleotide exchange factor GrpE, partial [Oscillospiraceae bacterium]|nr:nucleotide exchange factor GrpE [Oscillospiraceae bacterium]
MTEKEQEIKEELEQETQQEEAAAAEEAKEPSEVEKLQAELADAKDQLLRKIAEFDNFRKRTQKEKEAIYPQAKADTVEKFVPIIDNFERALACECADPEFKKGID